MGIRSKILEVPRVYDNFSQRLQRPNLLSWLVSEFIVPDAGERVLDIGCGTAPICSYMPDVEYVGIDHNVAYLEEAKKRHGSHASFHLLKINQDDMTRLGTFDKVMLIGVLHHLSDLEILNLLITVRSILRPKGRICTLDPALVSGQHPIARFLARLDRGRFVRTPDHYESLLRSTFNITNQTLRHDLLRVPYTHIAFSATRQGH